MASRKSIILATSFNMFYENFTREKNLAEFALHTLRMLEDSLENLYCT